MQLITETAAVPFIEVAIVLPESVNVQPVTLTVATLIGAGAAIVQTWFAATVAVDPLTLKARSQVMPVVVTRWMWVASVLVSTTASPVRLTSGIVIPVHIGITEPEVNVQLPAKAAAGSLPPLGVLLLHPSDSATTINPKPPIRREVMTASYLRFVPRKSEFGYAVAP